MNARLYFTLKKYVATDIQPFIKCDVFAYASEYNLLSNTFGYIMFVRQFEQWTAIVKTVSVQYSVIQVILYNLNTLFKMANVPAYFR